MTGLPEFNRPAFHGAESELGEEGYTVLNPAILPNGLTQAEYMDIDLAMLKCADAIYLLEDWVTSKGARAELALAEKLGLQVFYQESGQ
jgi:hypothetical protein